MDAVSAAPPAERRRAETPKPEAVKASGSFIYRSRLSACR